MAAALIAGVVFGQAAAQGALKALEAPPALALAGLLVALALRVAAGVLAGPAVELRDRAVRAGEAVHADAAFGSAVAVAAAGLLVLSHVLALGAFDLALLAREAFETLAALFGVAVAVAVAGVIALGAGTEAQLAVFSPGPLKLYIK